MICNILIEFRMMFCFYRVIVKERDIKVNIFDMVGYLIFYEVNIYVKNMYILCNYKDIKYKNFIFEN